MPRDSGISPAALRLLNAVHTGAMQLLAFESVDPNDAFGQAVRRWARDAKLRIVNHIDPDQLAIRVACHDAIERAHGRADTTSRATEEIPTLAIDAEHWTGPSVPELWKPPAR